MSSKQQQQRDIPTAIVMLHADQQQHNYPLTSSADAIKMSRHRTTPTSDNSTPENPPSPQAMAFFESCSMMDDESTTTPATTTSNQPTRRFTIIQREPVDTRGMKKFKALLVGDGWRLTGNYSDAHTRAPHLNWGYSDGSPPVDPRQRNDNLW
eukprot:gene17171-20456_t